MTAEADNEFGATLLRGNVLYCSSGHGPVLGDAAVGSSVAAGTDEGGKADGTVSDADLACGRDREGLPAGGSWAGEQDYELVSWCGFHRCGEQMESQAESYLFDLYVDGFPGHKDQCFHFPGPQSREAWL